MVVDVVNDESLGPSERIEIPQGLSPKRERSHLSWM